MAVETQYNIVKVNELRPISVAQGVDELIINDLDSTPLETKKITVEEFAISIKDYILPIATEEVLGGVKIGEGLTINPITGVLSNDVTLLNDLNDVIVLSPQAGHVLRYNGVQWINEAEGGIIEVIAGEGLNGGGIEGQIVLNVNAGPGLIIQNDMVTVNVGAALEIVTDKINVRVTDGLTITQNSIAPVPGVGLNVAGGAINFVPSLGLTQYGPGIRVDIGDGLALDGNKVTAVPGINLEPDINNNISVPDASYTVKGVSKFAPLLPRIEDFRGTPSYQNDSVNPELLDTLSFVPTGAVFHFAGNTPPPGFLFCNGSTVSRTQYQYLFAVIGLIYNTGGESDSEFRLPDLRDEFIRGATTTDATGDANTRSRAVGTTETDKVKIHTHELNMGEISASVVTPGAFPTTSTSGFVWGFTMNNCTPPHRSLGNGNYEIGGDGDHYYNFDNGQFELNNINQADSGDAVPFYEEPEIPPGCARVEFPVRIETSPSSIQNYPTTPTPANDIDETRPRNIALLPCIKF